MDELTGLATAEIRARAALGYYVYTLGEDGHVTGRTAIMCEGDEEAKVQAKALVDGHIVELWESARRIAIFTPEKLDKYSSGLRPPTK